MTKEKKTPPTRILPQKTAGFYEHQIKYAVQDRFSVQSEKARVLDGLFRHG